MRRPAIDLEIAGRVYCLVYFSSGWSTVKTRTQAKDNSVDAPWHVVDIRSSFYAVASGSALQLMMCATLPGNCLTKLSVTPATGWRAPRYGGAGGYVNSYGSTPIEQVAPVCRRSPRSIPRLGSSLPLAKPFGLPWS